MITINYKDARPIHEQIRSGFVRLISTGVLGAGEKLPSVRELAGQLTINPNTIQKAYARLEAEGYVYSVVGKGSFVSAESASGEKRKNELMTDLKAIVGELKEMSVSKEEIIKGLGEVYD